MSGQDRISPGSGSTEALNRQLTTDAHDPDADKSFFSNIATQA